MAEVKDFSSYARKLNRNNEGAASAAGDSSYKEKIRSHKLKVFFRTIIIAAVVLFTVIAIYVSWRDKEYSEAVLTMEATITNGSDSKVVDLAGFVIQYSKDGVGCYNSSGQPVWNQTYEMQNPIAHTCNSVVAIGDYNGHHVYVSNTSGSMGVVDTSLPIRDFCVSSQGVVAAILDGTDVTWIYLYDCTGNILASFKTTMKDSGYYMLSGYGDAYQVYADNVTSAWVEDGALNIDPHLEDWAVQTREFAQSGFTHGTEQWGDEWKADHASADRVRARGKGYERRIMK